ncbi:GGDEF domain-containing protein [Bhargavaea ginsengi]|uniref:GGDEF domain-containing protein n=1 Tax=Bhargavaea ginsengi TaxID=426757 RepID=UPI00203DE97D|nr:GGDEF domain-containing protein [Bhargavaea ginsengi]MCM3088960.1 GGDEF domain-containing protein [Bhargavaea ginsengi]
MRWKGRLAAAGIVVLFNIVRYFYYHVYLDVPFGTSFFLLTVFFLAIAYVGGYQFDRADYLSRRDPLTGAYNRRSLIEYVRKLQLPGHPGYGVVLFDLDDFKEINDTWGHETGDAVLRDFAETLSEFVGNRGIIARWGGDEFLAIFRKADEDFKIRGAEEISARMSSLGYAGGRSIGVSFGIAVSPTDGKDLEALVDAADHAMYVNKTGRKSQV